MYIQGLLVKSFLFLLLFLFLNIVNANENEKNKVSVQFMWLDQFEFAGFYMAKEKGFYKDVDLEVDFHKFDVNTSVTNRVLEGKSDFGTNSTSLLIDKSKGKDIVLLGSVFQSSPLILLGLKDSNIKTIADIKNKKVMLTEDQQHFATLQSMLASKNVKINDLKVIEHSFDVDDIINKKADLMLAYTTNEPFILQEKGYKGKIFHPKDYGFDFYEELIFTSKEFAKQNPNTVKNFYNATIKGWEYAFENITETAQLIYDEYNVQNKTLESLLFEAEEMKKLVFDKEGKIGTITNERIRLIENSYRIMGLIKESLDVDDLIYTEHLKRDVELSLQEKRYLKNKKEISMCIDPDWMPFEKNENGKHIGMSADYMSLISKKIATPIEMINTSSWSQSLQYGVERKCDIFSLVMSTPQREKFLNFTKPYMNIPLVVASKLNAPFIENINQVKDKKVGIVKDYAYGEILRVKHPNINFVDVENITDGLNKVEDGKIFGFIGTLATVGYHIQKDYIGQLKISGKFEETWDLGIGTRSDEPILKDIFNKAIESISFEDKQNILNKWISVNYQQEANYELLVKILIVGIVLLLLLALLYRQYLLNKLNKELNEKIVEEIEKNDKQNQILSQQAKMAAMGEMIGNIAHQWRQPLNVISITATGLKFKKEFGQLNDEDFIESLNSINNSAQFLSSTIDDFRNFLKENKAFRNVQVTDIVNKALELVSSQFTNKDIKIIKNIEDTRIYTLENELIQVLINILNNSRDALIEKNEDKYIFLNTYVNENELLITIKDSAGGIDENIVDKVFDPYFTTKHQAQGTGIGLYMSEQMITNHMKGSICVENIEYEYESKRYKGAQFKINLAI